MVVTYATLPPEIRLPQRVELVVDGHRVKPASGRYFAREDPSKPELQVAEVPHASPQDVRAAIDAAREAFDRNCGNWVTDYKLREKVLFAVGQLIREQAERLATFETLTSGKTIRTSLAGDAPRCAELFEYYAGLAGKLLGQAFVLRTGDHVAVYKEPVGVVGAIVPWNPPS